MCDKRLLLFKDQRVWLDGRIKSVQENFEYCSISMRIEKGNITVFKIEKTELVPKKIVAK